MYQNKRFFFLAILLAVFWAGSQLTAQVMTADIVGTVTDTTGAVLPDAQVTITNTATGVSNTSVTTKTGNYTFTLVQVGTYVVKVEAKGFKAFETSNLTLNAGDRARVDAKLEVGAQSETVSVTAEATSAALHTDSSTLGGSITRETVEDVPLNGRNITTAIQLSAGVGVGNVSPGGPDQRMTSSYSANGQNTMYNNNMIDGVDNNERLMGFIGVRPSVEAIQEVRVMTNLYSAEVSRTAGGVAELITKSGTNGFHGSAFEFLRNDALDAQGPIATTKKAPLRQNQFGGSFGGPIKKNKTFVFTDYEEYRIHAGQTITAWVPTQEIHDDPSSLIPAGYSITDIGRAYFSLFPAPNASAAAYNYVFNANKTQTNRAFDVRIDQHFSDNNSLYGRYSLNRVNTIMPGTLPASTVSSTKVYSGWVDNIIREQNLALDFIHIFKPTILLELKASYSHPYMVNDPMNDSSKADGITMGFPCTDTSCINDAGIMGIPDISFNGTISYAELGNQAYQGYINNIFQESGALTWTHGSHSTKTGVGLIRRQAKSPIYQTPVYTITGDYTGSEIGDLLTGQAAMVYRREALTQPHFRTWEPSAYVQDDWRITKWLTLNLGVRYDIYTPLTEVNGSISNFDADSALIVSPELLGAHHASKTAGVKTTWGNVAPRVGFSATLSHKTVLRGGFGMSYFPSTTHGQAQMQNIPFYYTLTCGLARLSTAQCAGDYAITTSSASTTGGADMTAAVARLQLDSTMATNTANYASNLTVQAIDNNFKDAYLEQFSLQLEKEWAGNVVTAGYVGNLGRHLPVLPNINAKNNPSQTDFPLAATGSWMNTGMIVNMLTSASNSYYNSGQFTFQRRYQKGLTATVNYTWAHAMNQGQAFVDRGGDCPRYGCVEDNPSDTSNPHIVNGWQEYDLGNSDLDVRHRITGMVNYQLPFGKWFKGTPAKIIGGWTISTASSWQTGTPFTVGEARNRTGLAIRGATRPNVVGSTKRSNRNADQWFNISAIHAQTLNTLGNERRDQIVGPHSQEYDLSLGKEFGIYEKLRAHFRLEAFNFTNTPILGTPGSNVTAFDSNNVATNASGFGASTKSGARQVQLGLKLTF
jgi:outer membrane receptor protein involved in Fe transport